MKNLIYLSTLLLFISSCSKDPCGSYQSKEYNYFLNDSTKAQIPFNGYDTLTYTSNKGDTALLIGKWKINSIDSRKVNTSGNPDCPKNDIYRNEFVDVLYLGSNQNLFSLTFNSTVNNWKDEYTKTIINNISEYNGYTYNYNSVLLYTTPVIIGSQTIYGFDLDRKDGLPSFVYNKAFGLLQIKITDSLTYTLNK